MQRRLRNYKNELTSFPHNIFNLGMHSPGRYMGFDSMTSVSGLTISINHSQTGLKYKTVQNQLIGPLGIILSRQGVVIQEDAAIQVTLDSNVGNPRDRHDLIVFTHDFQNVVGGQDGTYSVIKGPINNYSLPVLSDPNKQIIIGVVTLAAGSGVFSGLSYQRQRCPDSGDSLDASINYPNFYNTLNAERKDPLVYQTETLQVTTPVAGYLWKLNPAGNVFDLSPTIDKPIDAIAIRGYTNLVDGIEIDIWANENVFFRSQLSSIPLPYTNEYYPIVVDTTFINTSIFSVPALSPVIGQKWIITLKLLNSKWVVKSVGGQMNNVFIPTGTICPWAGITSGNFDTTGLGINTMKGWALCNGLHGTIDLRGLTPSMATNVPSAGAGPLRGNLNGITSNVGDEAGNNLQSISIAQENIPDYGLTVHDPGHRHTIIGSTHDIIGFGHVPGADPGDPEPGGFTEVAATGISVRSGGSGTPLELDNRMPTKSLNYIQKL